MERATRRTALAVVCLAVLLVTAGCSGLLSGGEERSTRTPYDVSATQTPTATPTTTTPTPAPTPRTPPVLASSEFQRRVENHSRVLADAGPFAVRQSTRRVRGDLGESPVPAVNQTFAADLGADRYWFGVENVTSGVYDAGEVYQNGSTVYYRQRSVNGTVVYQTPLTPREPTPAEWVRGWVRSAAETTVLFPFERNGSADFAGEVMVRYTAADPPVIGCTSGGGVSTDAMRNVTEFRATAVVDHRGLVRKFDCRLVGNLNTGRRYEERLEWTLFGVENGSLRPPERTFETNLTDDGSGDSTGR